MARIVQPSVAHGGIFMLLAVFSRHRRSIRPPELRGRLTGRGRGQTGLVLQGLLRNAPSPLVRAISSIGMRGRGTRAPWRPGCMAGAHHAIRCRKRACQGWRRAQSAGMRGFRLRPPGPDGPGASGAPDYCGRAFRAAAGLPRRFSNWAMVTGPTFWVRERRTLSGCSLSDRGRAGLMLRAWPLMRRTWVRCLSGGGTGWCGGSRTRRLTRGQGRR